VNLFLDTEWADTIGSELVSLALISEDGEHVFHAERDPLPAQPGDFVRAVIYPLLERGTCAMDDRTLTLRLRAFIATIPEPRVFYGYFNDYDLFQYVLSGFELPDAEIGGSASIFEAMHLENDQVTLGIEAWSRVMRIKVRVDIMPSSTPVRCGWRGS